MNLESRVVFKYSMVRGYLTESKHFKTLRELQCAIEKFKADLFTLTVSRIVMIIDKDSKKEPDGIERTFIPNTPEYKTVAFPPETITFSVTQKLMYPDDVRKLLMQKYNCVFDFDNTRREENIPVRSFHANEHSSIGLRDEQTGAPSNISWLTITCDQCRPTDIVIDKNLHQIWPEKTNTTPESLIELLSKTTEKVH